VIDAVPASALRLVLDCGRAGGCEEEIADAVVVDPGKDGGRRAGVGRHRRRAAGGFIGDGAVEQALIQRCGHGR